MRVASQKPSITVAGIRAEVVERLHEVLPDHRVAFRDDDPLSLSLSGNAQPDKGLVLNLHALVRDVLTSASQDRAHRLIESFVALAGQTLTPPKITLASVYPLLRHREMLDAVGAGSDALVTPGPGDMATVIAADVGSGLVLVSEDVARQAGLDPEAVREAADSNLRALYSRICLCEEVDGVLPVMLDGYAWLGSSLLLMPGLLRAVMEEQGWSRSLMASPVREVVGMVDADSPKGFPALTRWMRRELGQPRTQSEFIFTLSSGDGALRRTHKFDCDQPVALS